MSDLDKEYQRLLKRLKTNLQDLREEKGLTQEQMTEYGFNYRYYQKLESGNYAPNLYTLTRLAKVFKVQVADLLS